ncbi:acyltransferase 3 [Solidesulfovibrio carbinoliphilus subsp. oakridgensis]|uniref:Acyltransferase 3 n=1 Tax=Solidesulfovibrio carbinoliphilus subsp. oakridgensis TaxID=694327 RepID=G7Q9M6_9BACT|nr:acyltransferase family protein [Solidesulfovibrio carbinoliphilus]EHJ48666.1 acyltransferase 3 [Solidesulfovibrio carbinoliphilus subsp. oakridgensis]
MRKRNVAFDVLKVVSACGVILIHVTASLYACAAPGKTLLAAYVLNGFGRSAVPVFLMVAGALLFEAQAVHVRAFYRRGLARFFLPTVLWTLLYKAVIFLEHGHDVYDFLYLFKGKNPAYHLWYMWMFLGLIVAFPFLHAMVHGLSRERLRLFLVVCGIYAFLVNPFAGLCNRNIVEIYSTIFGVYVFYFVFGHYLHTHVRTTAALAWGLGGLFVVAFVGNGYAMQVAAARGLPFGYAPETPESLPVLVQSFALYYAARHFLRHRPAPAALAGLSGATYGIYLVHVLVIHLLRVERLCAVTDGLGLALAILGTSLLVFGLSYALVRGLRLVPGLRVLAP